MPSSPTRSSLCLSSYIILPVNQPTTSMANLRNRNHPLSASSSQAQPPSPIPTGKGSRSAADPAFSEYIASTKLAPELILPKHVRRSEPADIDHQLLLSGDDDSVNRLLRSAVDLGVFQISGHGISCEELKSTLIENQWVFEELKQTGRHYADREELVWCHEIAEKAENILSDRSVHIFRQTMDNVAGKLEAIAEELALIIARGATNQLKKGSQTSESTLVLYRYHQSNAIADQMPSPTNGRGQVSSKHALNLHLLLESGEFFSEAEGVGLSFCSRRNTIIVTVGDDFEGERAGKFKYAIENLKFKPDLKGGGPLFSLELKWTSSDLSAFGLSNSAKKFSLADQILVLLLLAFLYKTCCFLCS